ncbi:hypothetical protein BA177_10635 [Woeseia oceani]|uniref:N-acetyltransferase domain-containing protein n=1 Tax=Woeseia oceani TaxID=1548547 RepID=A0A193LGK5_9GAMM|nr:hypothetical protein BA177_10635 [Woeseia oceani]
MAVLPVLETPRLILRSFVPEDAAAVTELAADRRIADTTLNIPHPYDLRMAEEWIGTHAQRLANGEQAAFAVTLKSNLALIGAVSLGIERRFRRANLGYWIGVPWWHQGYATEAARVVVDFGFAECRLHRVHAVHLPRNPASGRVLQKIGMQQEGVQREHTCKNDVYEDLVLYGVLQRQWQTDKDYS